MAKKKKANQGKISINNIDAEPEEYKRLEEPVIKKQVKKKKKDSPRNQHAQESFDEIEGVGIFTLKGVLKFLWWSTIMANTYLVYSYCNVSTNALLWTTMNILYHSLALLSEAIFPITTKDRRINIVVGAYLYGFNFLYLYPGYMIISGQADQESQPERIAATLIMFIFGVFLTMTSNSQKYFILKAKEPENKKRDFLITEGMFGWTRNPNYLGTIITNFALCCLYREWDAWILYSLLLFMSMLPMMLKKEGRLRAKNGAEEYFKRSGFLFPKFTESCLLNFLIYLNIMVLIFLLYLSGGAENTAKNIIHMIKHCGIDWEQVNTTISPIVDQIFTATGFK